MELLVSQERLSERGLKERNETWAIWACKYMGSSSVGIEGRTFAPFSPQNEMPTGSAETFNLYNPPQIKRPMLWNGSGPLALEALSFFTHGRLSHRPMVESAV